MISIEDLNKCISNLAELNARTNSHADKTLLLEIGYILKQEIDNVNAWNQANNPRGRGVKQIDVQKLLEDNTQLYNENQKLIAALNELTKMFEKALPSVQTQLQLIGEKFDALNEHINNF